MAFDTKQAAESLARAETALARGRNLLERAAWTLRERSLTGGQVSASKLDEAQIVCFDMAIGFAEVTAAQFAIEYAKRAADAGGERSRQGLRGSSPQRRCTRCGASSERGPATTGSRRRRFRRRSITTRSAH